MLVTARPIGSTVRLRDPAQADRQGSHPQSCHGGRAAEREGMEWRVCRLPATVPAVWSLPVLLSATSRVSRTLSPASLCYLSSSMPGHSALLLQHCPHPLPSPHSDEKAQRLKPPPEVLSPACPFPVSSYFSSWKQGLRSWGLWLRKSAATSLWLIYLPRARLMGLVHPDRWEVPYLCYLNNVTYPHSHPFLAFLHL